ncbi:MAG: hypothetical protein MPN21_18950 [Thermoanaerobaculia bacterium]|nr:hypothetical protein [Thermoanaerobaculia bacterium]
MKNPLRHRVLRFMIFLGSLVVLLLVVLTQRRLFDGTKEDEWVEGKSLPDSRPLLVKVSPSPDRGFHHPYFLLLPETLDDSGRNVHLLVEPNNTGTSDDDLELHQESALRLALRGHPRALAERLAVPLLVPAFPRPRTDWRIYTHALDRDTMRVEEGDLAHIDLQLLAMVRHARVVLESTSIETTQGLWMHGFSASGSFVNRFAALHPGEVQAVAAGGLNALPILPFGDWEGTELPYPIGVSDLAELTGTPFDADAFSRVEQWVYMGELDRNDTLPYGDAWSDEEKQLISSLLGETMMPDRWQRVQTLLADASQIRTVTYVGVGHEIPPEILDELVTFFRSGAQGKGPDPDEPDRGQEIQ